MSQRGARSPRWQYSAPIGARLCDLLCFGAVPKVPLWRDGGSMVESPSSESLSSLSRWGSGDHENEVVSLESTQEGEDFVVGEAVENIIEKLNGTPRSEDNAESIRALLQEAVAAGGSNLRENMALYFITKRGLEFGMEREDIDKIIDDAALGKHNDVDLSVEVSSSTAAPALTADDANDEMQSMKTVGVKVARMQAGVDAIKLAEGTYEDELPDLVPDRLHAVADLTSASVAATGEKRSMKSAGVEVPRLQVGVEAIKPAKDTYEDDLPDLVVDHLLAVDDLLAPSATRSGSGTLLPPPEQLTPGAIGGRSGTKAAKAPPSSRAGSLQ